MTLTKNKFALTLAIFALAVGGFAIGTNEFTIMGLLTNMSDALHVSPDQAGLIIAAYAMGVVVGAPLFAALGAKLGRKQLVLGLIAFYVIANMASFFCSGNYAALMLTRFLSGMPHGAFFGVAGVIAATLVAPTKRAWAISMVMMGLSIANVIGVPAVTWLGQQLGWQVMFVVVSALSALCFLLVLLYVPHQEPNPQASVVTELSALREPQVWFALAIGAIGFGGFFAVYTYVAPTVETVTHLPQSVLPIITGLYGLGMVVGNYLGGRLADWSIRNTILLVMGGTAVVLVMYHFLVQYAVAAFILVFVVGAIGSALVPALQSRLLDSAPSAPSLAASLNHSALNIGNFLGAYLGSVVIALGWGYLSTPLVGAALALLGLILAIISFRLPMPGKQHLPSK